MPKDVLVCWRVAVEIIDRIAHSRDMSVAMRAEERFIAGKLRQTPFPVRMGPPQMRRTSQHARRTLRVAVRGIFPALWIVKENQTRQLALQETAEVRPVTRDQENLEHSDDNAGHHFVHARSHAEMEKQNVENDRRKNCEAEGHENPK